MYVNIRGVKGKQTSLIEQLDYEKPHLFLLTETLLPTNANIKITGYTFFGRERQNKKGGGIGILMGRLFSPYRTIENHEFFMT